MIGIDSIRNGRHLRSGKDVYPWKTSATTRICKYLTVNSLHSKPRYGAANSAQNQYS